MQFKIKCFAGILHDSTIERDGNTLHLSVSTDGGFSSKLFIHLILKCMTSEVMEKPIQVGQWFVYDEFAFRVR
ncbi:DUF4085 family protein [Cytobacillus sp. Hm23]